MTRGRELLRAVPPRARAFIAVTFVVLAAVAWRGGSFCPFALLTGIPCPGCGLGRATIALVSGHPIDAFHFHPLVFVATPTLGWLAWSMSAAGARARSQRFVGVAAGALLVAALGVWVARFEGAFGGPVKVSSLVTR